MSISRSISSVRRLVLSLAFLAAVPASSALGQRADSLRVGARVRVETRVTTPRAILGVPFTALTTIVGAIIGSTDRTVWEPVWPRTPAR